MAKVEERLELLRPLAEYMVVTNKGIYWDVDTDKIQLIDLRDEKLYGTAIEITDQQAQELEYKLLIGKGVPQSMWPLLMRYRHKKLEALGEDPEEWILTEATIRKK